MPLKPLLALTLFASIATAQTHSPMERRVAVDRDVQLEVLDWGGTGRPLVLLTGLGDTAHVYDGFAPKLSQYHVYAITRRGFGPSSIPAGGYTAGRLADDVLAVLDALSISKPVLAGHSIAGEELSSIATRHPEQVAGLIYLDAALSFAFYDPALGDMNIDSITLQRRLQQLSTQPPEPMTIVTELLDTDLPAYERDLREFQRRWAEHPPTPAQPRQSPAPAERPQAVPAPVQAIVDGEQKFTNLGSVRMLAIYAMDPGHGKEAQSAAFERANPSAPVVRLKNANHYVFRSNEAEVLRAMNDFIATLP